MVVRSLIGKDIREHRMAALFLGLGSLAMILLLLTWNRAAAFSMSPFEVVRLALLSFLPLIALIVGNRLIVQEYLSGTRQFVEALPVGVNLPLLLKFLLGYGYLCLLSVVMILLAAQQAGIADDVTSEYVLLITAKTLVMLLLYWSVVFCFSLCGHLRIALYLLGAALVALVAWYPGIDADRFAPFALMDDQLFVFERDLIPWTDMAITAVLGMLFVLAGFILTRLGEGSVVERLAKPMTRRDYVALGVLAMSGLAVWSTLLEPKALEPLDFTSEYVVRLQDPDVSVLYLDKMHEASAVEVAERISESLVRLQASLGLSTLPDVRLVLAPERDKFDFDYSTADGVFITANWLEHDSFDNVILDTVILHGVMSAQTAGRAMFEPYHWVLDGFTRWWVEQGNAPIDPSHKAELTALALWALDTQPEAWQLVNRWQLTADRFSYHGAEALAWAAMSYLEQSQGREKVLELANEFLVRPVPSNLLGTVADRVTDVKQRLENVLQMPWERFSEQWQLWLQEQEGESQVQDFLSRIPALEGEILVQRSAEGVQEILISYQLRESGLPLQRDVLELNGQCVLKHDYIGPFDTEFEVSDDYENVAECVTEGSAHVLDNYYTSGDRVYIALDYETPDFHRPLRLFSKRLSIP